jgi:hypothetical protein
MIYEVIVRIRKHEAAGSGVVLEYKLHLAFLSVMGVTLG